MKVLVMSDSHGAKNSMLQAVKKESPDYILHLGDNEWDTSVLSEIYPDIPLRVVKGNCDGFSGLPATEGFALEGKNILMTHGHLFYVKTSMSRLQKYAKEQKPDIVLFGHTHIPYKEEWKDMLFINPGSIGYSTPKTYAVISIIDGMITCEFKTL